MSGRRFVSAAWLMCVCVVVGCASGPSRNLFSRRSKSTTSEDEFVNRLMADAKRLEKKGDRESANNLRDQASAITASKEAKNTADNTTQLATRDRGSPGKSPNTNRTQAQANLARAESPSATKRRPIELPDDVADQPADFAAPAKVSSKQSPFSLNDDASATARLQLNDDSDDFTKSLREPPKKRLGGGQFGVASRLSIEAPTPKRRADVTSDAVDAVSSVISADYQSNNFPTENFSADVIQNVVPAGATDQTASGVRDPSNPWNQFRGLTKPFDPTSNAADRIDPLPTQPRNVRSSAETRQEFDRGRMTAPNRMSAPDMNNNDADVPQQWPSNSTNGSSFVPQNNGPYQNNGPDNGTNQDNGTNSVSNRNALNPRSASPELWPGAAGANGFGRSNDNLISNAHGWSDTPPSGTATNPNNIQPVNGEQSRFASAVIPGFNFPAQQTSFPNGIATESPTNSATLFPLPNGAPVTIAPFASSPDLDRLIVQTSAEAAAMVSGENEIERQAYLRKHVQLRLLHLIAGQMDRALQPVPNVDAADQEFWQQMLWGIANYFDLQGMPDSDERATQTIAQLRSAASRLQEKARLELHSVAFCHKITSFGNYQRFKRDEFTPGQPVLLYAEVSSFKSEPTSDGQFRTLMKSSVEVFEGGIQGRMIESIPFAPSEDRCRNHRRDYFHSYEFAIPQGISSGPHVLRLTVEDQLGKKTAVTTLNFTVQ